MRSFVLIICSLCFTVSQSLPVLAQTAAQLKSTSTDFTEAAKIGTPAVVFIQVKSKSSKPSHFYEYDPSIDLFQDEFFGRFFGIPRKEKLPSQVQISQGSGFLVSGDGLILTNSHVISERGTITVKLNDGRELPAKIVGEDDATDVALLKIEGKDFPYLKLGNSEALNIGQWVIAIGNPLGLQASVTAGIVSAKGRSNLDIAKIEDFIQTDAAINRGNSGGPLLNLQGEVIGINTAIATNYGNGGYMGIGFAIPSNMARHVMDQLVETGSVTRGYIGVVLQEINSDLAESFALTRVGGALVAEVLKNSPAEQGGVKQGDVILSANKIKVDNIGTLRNYIALQKPGTEVALEILRNGKPMSLKVAIESASDQMASLGKSSSLRTSLGIEVQSITPELARQFHLDGEGEGVVITNVDLAGTGAFAGLTKGAVILSVDQQKVKDAEEFHKLLDAHPPGRPLLLLVKQGDTARYLSIKIED
jgi:serine protease Do